MLYTIYIYISYSVISYSVVYCNIVSNTIFRISGESYGGPEGAPLKGVRFFLMVSGSV